MNHRIIGTVRILVISALFGMTALTAASCKGVGDATPGMKAPSESPKAMPALSLANLDTTCAACTDFYQFANGGWLKHTKIPAAYPSYGGFEEVYDRNNDVLHDILEKAAADAKAGTLKARSSTWKVGTYYGACMDTATIEKLGASPIKPMLDRISAIKSSSELPAALAQLEHSDGLTPFGNGAEQDPKDATTMIVSLSQGGLTLPERDYYFRTDSVTKNIRAKFVAHVTAMMQLAGDTPEEATTAGRTVLAFETQLAKASRTPTALRDPVANYHKMMLADVQTLAPHMDWAAFYKLQGAPTVPAVDVGQPEYITAVDGMIASVPLKEWQAYLRWHAVHSAAAALSNTFVQENFAFEKLLTGATEVLPRWKRCSGSVDNAIGELLGQEFVAKTFPPDAKARAVKIVGSLIAALKTRIDSLDWMSAATKPQALAKLAAFTRKIGYPDTWRDYSALTITSGTHWANRHAGQRFESVRNWNKLGKPVDRTEWGMTPPTVNAYYNPQLNEIVFPAGILQPPFYNASADDAFNYGAMGAVIGHEMTHGFDDQGRQYDKDGNLKDWWAKRDAAKYVAEADKVVRQFNSYTIVDTLTHVNGKLTLGENIADFGGLTVAYAAMKIAIGSGPHEKIDGFTPEQRFFLGWATAWRALQRDEYSRMLVNADPHAPSKWRVNGPLSNMPEFKAAFGCKETDAMVRPAAARPRIW